MSEQQDIAQSRFLTFTLGGDMFALDIGVVREILDMTEITRIPKAPPGVRGVVNLRGAAVPVFDLRMRFGMEQTARTVHTRIIIVEIPGKDGVSVLGAIADSVKEVLELEPKAITPPPAMGAKVKSDFLRGIGKVGADFLLILDIGKVLSADEAPAAGETPGSAAAQDAGSSMPTQDLPPAK